MRFSGTLKSWDDERGYGFIEASQGGQEIFVHIKAFPSGTGRPSVGQLLSFEIAIGENKKKRAHSVQYARRTAQPARRSSAETSAPWTFLRALAIPVFAALYGYVAWRWDFYLPLLLAYLGLSLVTFMAYVFDKSAAVSGRWRTAEKTLHLLSLLGGWPGALLAQQLLRHKTSKSDFIGTFWTTVVLNVAVFVAWHAGVIPLPQAWLLQRSF